MSDVNTNKRASSRDSSPSPLSPAPKKIKLTDDALHDLTKENLVARWHEQDAYISHLETKLAQEKLAVVQLEELRKIDEQTKQDLQDLQHNCRRLEAKLVKKEAAVQDLLAQIQAMQQQLYPPNGQMADICSMMLDPAVNIITERLKKQVETLRSKLEEMQNDLDAWKFTPDSATGKRLMAKCKQLYTENEELGKQISQGRIAKLEGELSVQTKYLDQMKAEQQGINEFLMVMEGELDGFHKTILKLKQDNQVLEDKLESRDQAIAAFNSSAAENEVDLPTKFHAEDGQRTVDSNYSKPQENCIQKQRTTKEIEEDANARTKPPIEESVTEGNHKRSEENVRVGDMEDDTGGHGEVSDGKTSEEMACEDIVNEIHRSAKELEDVVSEIHISPKQLAVAEVNVNERCDAAQTAEVNGLSRVEDSQNEEEMRSQSVDVNQSVDKSELTCLPVKSLKGEEENERTKQEDQDHTINGIADQEQPMDVS